MDISNSETAQASWGKKEVIVVSGSSGMIGTAFRWVLFALMLLWVIGLILYQLRK